MLSPLSAPPELDILIIVTGDVILVADDLAPELEGSAWQSELITAMARNGHTMMVLTQSEKQSSFVQVPVFSEAEGGDCMAQRPASAEGTKRLPASVRHIQLL